MISTKTHSFKEEKKVEAPKEVKAEAVKTDKATRAKNIKAKAEARYR